eukprot:g22638.t1
MAGQAQEARWPTTPPSSYVLMTNFTVFSDYFNIWTFSDLPLQGSCCSLLAALSEISVPEIFNPKEAQLLARPIGPFNMVVCPIE